MAAICDADRRSQPATQQPTPAAVRPGAARGFLAQSGELLGCERQLRIYGHVARLPAEDPAHRILSCRDPRGWTMPRPHASYLRQVESHLRDTGMADLASAWVMARRRPI